MNFTTAATATGLVNSAIGILKSARELAKDASDIELKEKISDVYDVLLELKELTLKFDDENRELKARLAAEAAYVGPTAPHGYYYAASDEKQEHPLCPKCYQSKPSQKGFLENREEWNGGARRICKLCRHAIYEEPMDLSPRKIMPYNPY